MKDKDMLLMFSEISTTTTFQRENNRVFTLLLNMMHFCRCCASHHFDEAQLSNDALRTT